MSRSVGSRRLYQDSVSSGHHTKRTSMQTTGEFFYFDKYGRMAYRSQKVDFRSPSKWDAVSRRAKNEFKHARTDLSLQRVKVTCKRELTGHETEEINSTTEKQESKSSAEVKYKATYIVYENHNRTFARKSRRKLHSSTIQEIPLSALNFCTSNPIQR